jgi:hypothetical protein
VYLDLVMAAIVILRTLSCDTPDLLVKSVEYESFPLNPLQFKKVAWGDKDP